MSCDSAGVSAVQYPIRCNVIGPPAVVNSIRCNAIGSYGFYIQQGEIWTSSRGRCSSEISPMGCTLIYSRYSPKWPLLCISSSSSSGSYTLIHLPACQSISRTPSCNAAKLCISRAFGSPPEWVLYYREVQLSKVRREIGLVKHLPCITLAAIRVNTDTSGPASPAVQGKKSSTVWPRSLF